MTAADQVLDLPLKDVDATPALNIRELDPKDEGIRGLADSIKAEGQHVPVLVVKAKEGKGWRLVYGFRRVAACRLAKLTTVRAIVDDLTDQEILLRQISENVQRESLSPLQEARALQQVLSTEDAPTQAELAKRVGKSQPWLSNRIRLLGLPEPAVKAIENGLSGTHGEILLQLPKEATPNEVKSLLDQQKYNDLNARQFKAEVQQAAARINRRTKAKKARAHAKETAKFPDCPKKGCRKPGSPSVEYDGTVKDFRCGNGHYWSPKTGKLTHTYLDSQRDPRGTGQPRAPPPPTLPLVPTEVKDHPGAGPVARRLLDMIGEIEDVTIDSHGRDLVYVSVTAKAGGLSDVKWPPFQINTEYGERGALLRVRGYYDQSTDKARRAAAVAMQALVEWLGTIRGPGRPKKEEDQGSVPDAPPPRPPGSKRSKKGRISSSPGGEEAPPPVGVAADPTPAEPTTSLIDATATSGAPPDGP